MAYKFGNRSLGELKGVHPDLVSVCHAAIAVSDVDFGVFDGLRTAAEQNALYRRGASTMDGYRRIGRHQVQATRFGHAVDLVPWVDGRFQWDWGAIYDLTASVVAVARQSGVHLRWGGCWAHVNPLLGDPQNWVEAYVRRKREQGRRAFTDGPHFELYGAAYNADQPDLRGAA